MASKKRTLTLGYAAVVAASFAIALIVARSAPAVRIDRAAYDWMFTRNPVDWTPRSVIVAIDERTLSNRGGMRRIRPILAETLDQISAAHPAVVALDVILHDKQDEVEDSALAAAMRPVKNLVLPVDMVVSGNTRAWEDPLPMFGNLAANLGHVHLEEAGTDGVTRSIPLEEITAGRQHWALAFEAFRVQGDQPVTQSPVDVQVGQILIPAPRNAGGRSMYVEYLRDGIPAISAMDVARQPEMLRGKTVFLGITALTAANDRRVIPFGTEISGVEVHAHAFETIARGRFLTPARESIEFILTALFATGVGFVFWLRSSWLAYCLAAALLLLAHWTPIEFFRHDVVLRYSALVSVAWITAIGSATFRYFSTRGQLRTSETEKSRYQQAIHWAAHEMRTPLTAIQGSSEIMTRYSLPDQKRHELSEMINSESKRLARMIQTFLDVERLADGQMDLKREPFPMTDVVSSCLKRVLPVAERKRIAISLDTPVDGLIMGDRELMEYAVYNLLTNAVKYSPAETEVHVAAELRGSELRIAVRDQGIGMDAKELKSIFKKFYRTKRAEASGEAGTGIGLSIVEQIVAHHGGRMDVTSEPGRGSCFTMIFTAWASAEAPHNAETSDRRG